MQITASRLTISECFVLNKFVPVHLCVGFIRAAAMNALQEYAMYYAQQTLVVTVNMIRNATMAIVSIAESAIAADVGIMSFACRIHKLFNSFKCRCPPELRISSTLVA